MRVKHLFVLILFVFPAVAAIFLLMAGNEGKRPAQVERLPEVYFYDKSGKKITLKDFEGKTILVNLWATWCPPCVAEMAPLERLQAKLPRDRFEVVAISLDEPPREKVERFMAGRGLAFYWDQDRQIPLKWAYRGLPTSLLLDPKGNVIARYEGPYMWDQPPLMGDIRNFAEGKTTTPPSAPARQGHPPR